MTKRITFTNENGTNTYTVVRERRGLLGPMLDVREEKSRNGFDVVRPMTPRAWARLVEASKETF